MKKYEMIPSENGLYRIKALYDFGDVRSGDLGGFVENERNLSHNGHAWIYDNAEVRGMAKVLHNAKICDNAKILCKAKIRDNAVVSGNAMVSESAIVQGSAKVSDNAAVLDNARIDGHAVIYGKARVYGFAIVYGCSKIYDNAKVSGNSKIGDSSIYGRASVYGDAAVGQSQVYDKASVHGSAEIYEYSEICGNAIVHGYAEICGQAKVRSISDYIVFKNWWSSGRYFTWTKSNDKWKVGCFFGTREELVEKAYSDCEWIGKQYEAIVNYVESIKQIKKTNMTREEARQIGLKSLEGKADDQIYNRAPQSGKNTWTVGEYREALLNDTEIEGMGNPIDDLLHLEECLNEQGKSLRD